MQKKFINRTVLLLILLMNSNITQVFGDPNSNQVIIYNENSPNKTVNFLATNNLDFPIFVKIFFDSIKNLKPTDSISANSSWVQVSANSAAQPLFSLNPIKKDEGFSYRYHYQWLPGDPTFKSTASHLYLFPFTHGTKHKIGQGFGGKFSHTDAVSRFAIDFDMDIGTPILAARSGLVYQIKEDSDLGGPHKSYAHHANYIKVYHSDGTIGSYVHLQKNGATVKIGDRVSAGDLIGYSGNTGLSTGPHLHFSILKISDTGKLVSIPFRFRDPDNKAITPEPYEWYYSNIPGNQPFEIIYGNQLSINDYTDYEITTENTGKVDFYTKKIDDILILFLKNGHERSITATVLLNLKGVSSDLPSPITVQVPKLTEKFVTIVRPTKDSATNSWSYQFQYDVNVRTEEFLDHYQPTPKTNQLTFRTKQIGSTQILFVQNGFNDSITVTVDFNLRGVTSDLSSPITVTIPKLTEKFVTIVRPAKGAQTHRWSYKYTYTKN